MRDCVELNKITISRPVVRAWTNRNLLRHRICPRLVPVCEGGGGVQHFRDLKIAKLKTGVFF